MESILLCGGGSAVPGLGARLLRDVRGRIPASTSLQLLQPPDYMPSQTLRYASWLGGAVLSKVCLYASLNSMSLCNCQYALWHTCTQHDRISIVCCTPWIRIGLQPACMAGCHA